MSKFWHFIKFWLPSLVWMALIFTASADSHSAQHTSWFFVPLVHWLFPNMPGQEIDDIHHFFRKCGHFSEYAILAYLIRRTLVNSFKLQFPRWSWPMSGSVILLVFLYAASDEFHQSFIPTRTPLVADVFIDTAGGATGLLVLWLLHGLRKKR